ncbi:hypothetical protein [Paraburkholderia terrae]
MKGMNRIPAGMVPVALGRLEELKSFEATFKQAAGLPGDIPVLTFPLRQSEFRCVSQQQQGAGNFGFGRVELEDGLLMSMRLQMGGVQFYWLAEMTDPELWAAIDMWRRYQRIPIALKIEKGNNLWDMAFLTMDIEAEPMRDEKYRCAPRRVATPHDWKTISALVTGFMQMQATTDIPGIPLEHAFAAGLLTKQFEGVAEQEPLVKKAVIVKTTDGGRLLIG